MPDEFWFWKELKRAARSSKLGGMVDAHNHPFTEDTSTKDQYYRTANLPLEPGKWKEVDLMRPELVCTFRDRITASIQRRIKQGFRASRSYVDIAPSIGLDAIKIAAAVKKEFWERHGFYLQIAAYAIEGCDTLEKRELLNAACRIPEIEAIGCVPSRGRSDVFDIQASAQNMRYYFSLANHHGKILDMQIDQKNHPAEKETLELLVVATSFRNARYDMPIGATHCLSMSAWEDDNLINHALTRMSDLGVSLIVCPRATLNNKQDRGIMSRTHNSIAPWDLAMKVGVNVALGTDNVSDIYMPYSDGDVWKEVDVLLNTVRYDGDISAVADILTVNGRKALGI